MNLTRLVTDYGYLAVFVMVGAESLGVPIPGETALIVAGTYAGTTHRLSASVLFAVAALAAVIGDNIGYVVGASGGYRLARRFGHRVGLDETRLKMGRYLFDRHGPKMVFFGRFISVLRTYAAFLAGVNRMSRRTFFFYNAAGGVVWAAIFAYLSFGFGSSIEKLSSTLSYAVAIALVVVAVPAFLAVRRSGVRLRERALAAYPDELD